MTTPTGTISMSDVNAELGKASTALISLNDGDVRNLAGKASGIISMDNLRGKSAVNYGTVNTLSLSVAGGASPISAVTVRLQILSIDAYPQKRTFSIQYSFNGGAWTTSGLITTSITVNANATSSSLITIYNTPGATMTSSLKVRVSLTGHTTKESNTISGFYI